MKSKLITEYLLPKAIVLKSNNIFNSEILLKQECNQVYIGKQDGCLVKGKGFIVLDFGKELAGGLRILTGRFPVVYGGNIRLTFGESVNEAMSRVGEEKNATNNHSLREFEIFMPHLADQSFGHTGFRFVRIDFLDDVDYIFVNFYAAYEHREINQIGNFECDDEIINKIYQTSIHTLFLNLQNELYEGIKRDRLVWIGDMQPEVLAFSYLYNDYEIVESAINDSIKFNPLPCWFGNIPTYSFWLIEILWIHFKNTGNATFVKDKLNYIDGIISQLDQCVSEDGGIDFARGVPAREGFFLDWPSNGTKDSKEGNRFVFLRCLYIYKKLIKSLNEKENSLVDKLIKKLRTNVNKDLKLKQVVSLGNLVDEINDEQANQILFKDGPAGLSTFMSYFIFKSMSKCGNIVDTIEILKKYYGSMLERGATSFWEDFDVNWLNNSGRIDEITPKDKNDLHGDFGSFCYIGFRKSLCHGWSVGPISFLIEEVAGLNFNDDQTKLTISPKLGNLKYVNVCVPTRFGDVKVYITKDVKVEAPKGITVEIK